MSKLPLTAVVFITGSWDGSNGAAGSLLGIPVGAGVVEMDRPGCLSSRRLSLSRLCAPRLNVVVICILLDSAPLIRSLML